MQIIQMFFTLLFCVLLVSPVVIWLIQGKIFKSFFEWYNQYVDGVIEFLNNVFKIKKEK